MKKTLFLILTILCFSGLSKAQNKYSDPYKFEFKKITDQIYFAYRPEPLRTLVEGNSTIIINDKDVVVFDATGSPKGARRIVQKIKELTDKPVRYLINSHGHGDHTLGNQVFVENFPMCEIISRTETRKYMSAPKGATGADKGIAYVYEYESEEGMERRREYFEGEIERIKKEAKPGYEKVLYNVKEYFEHDLHLRRQEYLTLTVTAPTFTFENKLSIYRGEREIQLIYLGIGDTPGDVWLYLPKEKILCAPDAVVHPIPYGFSRNPFEWVKTLRKAMLIDFDMLIPGHGEIQYDKKYVSMVIELLESMHKQIKEAVNKGMSLEETMTYVNISELQEKFVNDDPVKTYYFEAYSRNAAIRRTYNKLTNTE